MGKVAKVIGTSKLRSKYESHEAKRALCAAYDLFLADERVLPSLSQLLGEEFKKRDLNEQMTVTKQTSVLPSHLQLLLHLHLLLHLQL